MADSPRLRQLFAFLDNKPNDTFVLFALAKEYEKLGDQEKALAYYLKLLDTDIDYVGAYYHLAKLYERKEQPEKAFSTYKEGMDIAKKVGDKHALSELAGAKLALGDEEDFE